MEIPDLPLNEVKEYMLAQDYLLKLETKKINLENLTDKELEQKRCFEKYFSILSKKLNLSNVMNSFFNERGYLLNEMLSVKDNIINESGKDKDLKKENKKLKQEINSIIEKFNITNKPKFTEREEYLFKKNMNLNEKYSYLKYEDEVDVRNKK